ncbi:MAG TPA: TlpA disulfide reductase family protein [Bryobacteraceae bacterium]|nr:TlpA disulfide reductase family protein [Bryobacteraceae bacterium]
MRFLTLLLIFLPYLSAASESTAGRLWADLAAKREALPGFHQEFEVSRTSKSAQGDPRSSKRRVVLDASKGQWRETSISGSGDEITIFDGRDLVSMEEGGDEYVKTKRKAKDDDPLPSPYRLNDPDWKKATEVSRQSCGLSGATHQCVLLEAPLKPWTHGDPGNSSKLLQGTVRALVDLETGLLISSRTLQVIENSRNGAYQTDTSCGLKRMSYGAAPDAALFTLPKDLREVKELSRWSPEKIKKQLAGKPAPELAVVDLQGNPLTLADFKGKTVLLDFWTTWCGPCRADGPAIEKLYKKYGGKELMIVGISVSEERGVVEKFLKEHPHSYPIALTTENDIPRAYQVSAFPTYMIIAQDGTFSAAVEGDQGFGELRKLLKKAGLDTD